MGDDRGVRGLLFRGAQFARVSAPKKKFFVPPLGNVVPPLKNPFFEKILIPSLNFFGPPFVLFTIKIHQKDYIFGCY